jgi:heat-inducible transcriptional repressor
MSGIGNLFSQPEFLQGNHAQAVARLLDNLEPWLREAAPNEPLNVYIGAENPIGKTSGATLIVSRFRSPYSDHSYIGVLGPTRQSYDKVMRLVRHAGAMLEEVL